MKKKCPICGKPYLKTQQNFAGTLHVHKVELLPTSGKTSVRKIEENSGCLEPKSKGGEN